MKQTITAVTTKAPGGMKVEAASRGFKIIIDEPEDSGGTDAGMSPVEALLCALGSCQTIAAHYFCAAHGIELRGFSVEVEGDLDPDGFLDINPDVRNGFQEIRFKMHIGADISQEKAEQFAHFIENHCPAGDSIGNGVPLKLTGVVVDRVAFSS
jgi:uncharacterized OsmC-like protein